LGFFAQVEENSRFNEIPANSATNITSNSGKKFDMKRRWLQNQDNYPKHTPKKHNQSFKEE